jgi:hypothetical protein
VGRTSGRKVARSRRWINEKMNKGVTIYDIDLPRGMTDLGDFYKAELEEIAKRVYPTIKIPWP